MFLKRGLFREASWSGGVGRCVVGHRAGSGCSVIEQKHFCDVVWVWKCGCWVA